VQGSRRDPLDLAHPGRVFVATFIAIFVVDQITKAIVRAQMPPGSSAALIPYVIRLTSVRNTGAAFGLFPGRQSIFVLTSGLVLFAIAAYWRRMRPVKWPIVVALAMVTAGALGNLVDRALIGRVTDFLDFAFVSFPVFNVADMAIVGGVGVLMLWILFGPEDAAEPTEDDQAPPVPSGNSEDVSS
jgi:signal peptidase II